jgi:hypothetical protein
VPDLITSDDKSIEGVGHFGQLRLRFAKQGEGKRVVAKVVESSVEFISMDEASKTIRKLGPAAEVVS